MQSILSRGIGLSRLWSLLALTFIVLLLSLSAAAQNHYYVATSGSDSNNGTSPATPWRHISKAIASFKLGTPVNGIAAVITVHAGTYSDEHIPCDQSGGAICVNHGGSSPAVRLAIVCDTQWSVPSGSGCLIRDTNGGDGTELVDILVPNVDFGAINRFGFDVSIGSAVTQVGGIVVRCTGVPHIATGNCPTNSVHIFGNYVHDLASSAASCLTNPSGNGVGIFVNTNHGAYMIDPQVIGNRVTNIGPQSQSKLNGGPGCQTSYGMYISTQGARIENNVVMDNAGFGIHMYGAPCSGVMTNNTIIRTEMSALIYGGHDCANGTPIGSGTISNNILGPVGPGFGDIQIGVFGGGSAVCTAANPILVSNNVFNSASSDQVEINTATTQANCVKIQGSKTEAGTTTFVNYGGNTYPGNSNDNLHLKEGSVAIANGSSACAINGVSPCVPQFDIAATIRPNPPSVGVYEAASSSGSAPSAPTGLTAQVQ